ncbi:penicillin-binding protein 2, partial [Candidatus Uhrbacteria bacterium]|nr:penicillin-binding protein 2 [Candidatus Uhrbacteria bacterium]
RNTTVNSVGGLHVNQWFFPDWKIGGHGYTNVTKALAWSVNTFFYMLGGGYQNFRGLGVSKIIRYAKSFGFGSPLGIDLPGERPGFLPTPEWKEQTQQEPWYIGDTYHLAIGQGGLLVTPLQLTVATAAVANGGTVYKPHLVRAFKTETSTTPVNPEILSHDFIAPANLAVVRQGLRETVTYGSARVMSSLPVAVAGKTGTAQWNTHKDPHAWFVGFAPYANPEIVITVLIEEGGEGSTVSVPVAQDFLSWYFNVYKKEKIN